VRKTGLERKKEGSKSGCVNKRNHPRRLQDNLGGFIVVSYVHNNTPSLILSLLQVLRSSVILDSQAREPCRHVLLLALIARYWDCYLRATCVSSHVYIPSHRRPQQVANCRDRFVKFTVHLTNGQAFANRLPFMTHLFLASVHPSHANNITCEFQHPRQSFNICATYKE
jgi:hypothetical protein